MGEDKTEAITVSDCLRIVREELNASLFRQIVQKAIAQAVEGDRMAREWLSQYVLPEEPEAFDGAERFKRVVFVTEAKLAAPATEPTR